MEEALERDGRGEEATVDDRERGALNTSTTGVGNSGERNARASPQRSQSERRLETGREPDGAMGAVAQHATGFSVIEIEQRGLRPHVDLLGIYTSQDPY